MIPPADPDSEPPPPPSAIPADADCCCRIESGEVLKMELASSSGSRGYSATVERHMGVVLPNGLRRAGRLCPGISIRKELSGGRGIETSGISDLPRVAGCFLLFFLSF